MDGAGHDGVRFGRAGRGCAGRHDLCSLGRQRVQRRRDRRRQSRGFPGLQPAHSGVRRNQPAEREWSNHRAKRCGTTARKAAREAAGSAISFLCRPGKPSAKIKPPSGGGRGVPDVSGDADPQTGYNVLVDGKSLVIGGTSAVAPLWSGLIALLNEKLGKPLGFLQPPCMGCPQPPALSTISLPDRTARSQPQPDGMPPQAWVLQSERSCCRPCPGPAPSFPAKSITARHRVSLLVLAADHLTTARNQLRIAARSASL